MAEAHPVAGKMSFMQKITKAMDKAGKQTSKAIVKGKIMAIQKMANAEATPEVPEIVGALERLKATKNEICALADVARYLYEARINEANYQVDMSHQLRDARTAENDGWSKLAVSMGNSLSRLESIYSEHCEKMKEDFVAPIEKFRDVNVNEVQKLKLKYKEIKSAYDVACAKEKAAKDSGQAAKMQAAFAKKQETEVALKGMRDGFLKSVEGLERHKNTELLGLVLDYWNKFQSFAKAQHNAVLSMPIPTDIDPTHYQSGQFATTTPGASEDDAFSGPEFVTDYNENAENEQKNQTVNTSVATSDPTNVHNDIHSANAEFANAMHNQYGTAKTETDNNSNNNNNDNIMDDINNTNDNNDGYGGAGGEANGYDSNGNIENENYANREYDDNNANNDYNNDNYDNNNNDQNYNNDENNYDNNNNNNNDYGDNNYDNNYDNNNDENNYDNNGYDDQNNDYNNNNNDSANDNTNNNGYADTNPFGSNAATGANAGNGANGTGAAGADPYDFDPYQRQPSDGFI